MLYHATRIVAQIKLCSVYHHFIDLNPSKYRRHKIHKYHFWCLLHSQQQTQPRKVILRTEKTKSSSPNTTGPFIRYSISIVTKGSVFACIQPTNIRLCVHSEQEHLKIRNHPNEVDHHLVVSRVEHLLCWSN